MGGSDLYALALTVLLFQTSVDEDILLWMDNSFTLPIAHPLARPLEFIHLLGTKTC